ncbi:TRAP transporter substrate-binding protein [Alkalilacustris brevis]|uniref:TRAP transporter substrate-binding protein n=1 Tax=Alkalilacustris brevis TaxID=2026338 RepID=UPI000E0DCFF8|nr:TRAP transporter substrate-binding protein [Alkalilacustris brevis]
MTSQGVQMRLGGYQGAGSVLTGGIARFCDELAARVGDRIVIAREDDVTRKGATARSLFDGIESGAFQAGYMNSGYLAGKVPELGIVDLPFSVDCRARAHDALDGEAGRLLRAAVRRRSGYRVLGFWDNGFRHITNCKHPIRTPADCTGLRVRTIDNRTYVETMAALGFAPVVTDVLELREAVLTGRVDAQENPLTNTVGFDIQVHHKHLTLSGHFFGVALFLCNEAWAAALPAELQGAIAEAADAATAHQRHLARQADESALDRLRADGVEVTDLGEMDRAAFKAACAAVVAHQQASLPERLFRAYLSS